MALPMRRARARERKKEVWGDVQCAPREDAEKLKHQKQGKKKKKSYVKNPATQALSTRRFRLPHSYFQLSFFSLIQ
jgi:hypothetical protein